MSALISLQEPPRLQKEISRGRSARLSLLRWIAGPLWTRDEDLPRVLDLHRSGHWFQPPVRARSLPQPERDRNGIDVDPRPPRRLIAVAMQFAMMRATDGDRVFVADLSSERAGLGESKMMRVGRRAAAHDAGLAGHESGMLLVAQANGLAHDAAADGADFLRDFQIGRAHV